jgi:hypothetical protein
MDGCLVDTREAVEWAYSFCGVKMPHGAWGKPWHEWLPELVGGLTEAEDVHDLKTKVYLEMLRGDHVRELPPMQLLRKGMRDGIFEVGVLTGASSAAADLVLAQSNIAPEHILLGVGMSRAQKTDILTSLRDHYEDVMYIDDDWIAGSTISAEADTMFIHYDGQTLDELEDQLWTP